MYQEYNQENLNVIFILVIQKLLFQALLSCCKTFFKSRKLNSNLESRNVWLRKKKESLGLDFTTRTQLEVGKSIAKVGRPTETIFTSESW